MHGNKLVCHEFSVCKDSCFQTNLYMSNVGQNEVDCFRPFAPTAQSIGTFAYSPILGHYWIKQYIHRLTLSFSIDLYIKLSLAISGHFRTLQMQNTPIITSKNQQGNNKNVKCDLKYLDIDKSVFSN